MKYFAIAAAALWIAGCSSFTSVTPAGSDTYVVGSKKPVDKADWVDAKSTALTRAIDFCNKQKKDMEEVGAGATGIPATTSAQKVEVTFKCATRL